MSALAALVVDDEPLARRRVIRLLEESGLVGVVAEAADVPQALSRLSERRPDVLILDIQMPGQSGFDLLEQAPDPAGAVIFVTAFDDQALRAFEAGSVDYVTKPIAPGRFLQALERAHDRVTAHRQTDRIAELQEAVETLRRALGERPRHIADLWVRVRGDHVRVPTADILWIQAERDYVRLHTADAQRLHHESLASLERRLDPSEFVRVHRSAILRRSAIVRLTPAPFGAMIAVLSSGEPVRIGRTYTSSVREALAGRA